MKPDMTNAREFLAKWKLTDVLAENELKTVVEDAYDEGHADGYSLGEDDGGNAWYDGHCQGYSEGYDEGRADAESEYN